MFIVIPFTFIMTVLVTNNVQHDAEMQRKAKFLKDSGIVLAEGQYLDPANWNPVPEPVPTERFEMPSFGMDMSPGSTVEFVKPPQQENDSE